MLCHVMSYQAVVFRIILCYVKSCHAVLWNSVMEVEVLRSQLCRMMQALCLIVEDGGRSAQNVVSLEMEVEALKILSLEMEVEALKILSLEMEVEALKSQLYRMAAAVALKSPNPASAVALKSPNPASKSPSKVFPSPFS
eukprot:g3620.t1